MLLAILALVIGVVALALLCWAVFQLIASLFSDERKRIDARLRDAGASHTPKQVEDVMNRVVPGEHPGAKARVWLLQQWFALEDVTAQMVARAGRNDPVWAILLLGLGFAILALAVLLLFGAAWWLALPVAVLAALAPSAVLTLLAEKRQALIEKQLPDLLDFISRSMSAGHDFNGALRLGTAEAPEPIREEFQRAFDEMNYGGTVHDAMRGLVRRIECPSMMFFAVAVIINREVGGSLASLLSDVATQVRERLTFRLKVRALTGEGRASAMILGAIPFLIAAALLVTSRQYLLTLVTDPIGRRMLLVGLLWMLFGYAWMRKLIRIRL